VHQSFINHRSYRYATWAVLAVFAAAGAYLLDKPRVPPNGGTWLGYTLGTVAALLVICLSLFGVRKRAFYSRMGTAVGWLSAHVYLGLAAIIVATLHSGLQFGANIHTLAYVLMWIVTLSGCWGMYAYMRYPALMSRHRGNRQRKELLEEISSLDEQCLELATISTRVQMLVMDAIRRTDLGGGRLLRQLRASDRSFLMLSGDSALRPARLLPNPGNRLLIEKLAELHVAAPDRATRARIQKLLEFAGLKAVLLGRLHAETRLAAMLRLWLAIHVPACCAVLAALCAHVTIVFLYW
jgi:hypothetical protein